MTDTERELRERVAEMDLAVHTDADETGWILLAVEGIDPAAARKRLMSRIRGHEK
jgi:hypothetical protein